MTKLPSLIVSSTFLHSQIHIYKPLKFNSFITPPFSIIHTFLVLAMASKSSHLLLILLFILSFISSSLQDYYTPNKKNMNIIDSCWRKTSNWAKNRQALADCAVGYGKDAIGGKLAPFTSSPTLPTTLQTRNTERYVTA